ncbi:prion-like protein doppel [Sorex araneus]|uniref:prion-like protein doppel n=1 Tax=Sorex araneus TaxID=42254 RepID=UPI0003316BCD|nr:prion-like protein doppel [Sorex araneus]
MRKHLGWCLAIACVLLLCQVPAAQARGIKHRIKWGRKAPPSTPQVTEARVAEIRPGAFIRQGRKLNLNLGGEDKRYYDANYWQFPDGIHYNGCSSANVTREKFISGCINATRAANQEELSREKDRLYQRVLWRLVRELCAVKHCDFWAERGASRGRPLAAEPCVPLGLGLLLWLLGK